MGGMTERIARVAAARFSMHELCAEWEATLRKRLAARGSERDVLDHLLGTWSTAIAERCIGGGGSG